MRKRLLFFCFSLFILTGLHSQNVGIGTAVPTATLDVVGSETTTHGKNAAITLTNTASSNSWILRAGANGTGTPKAGFSIADNINYRFVIDSTGKIGIGELSPIAPLSIKNGFYGNKIAFVGTGDNHYGIGVEPNLMQLYTQDGSSDIAFGYGNSENFTEKMRIRGSGNVGIGTNFPVGILHIKGTNWIKTVFENDTGEPRGYIGSDNNGSVALTSNAYWNGGAWVYPNESPSLYMLLHQPNQQFEFRVRPDGGSQNVAMVINVNGRVGIGTVVPLQKLDINGNASFNDSTIYLRAGSNRGSGLKYISGMDGAYLFGWAGGALGTADLPHSLTWDFNGNVGVRGNLLADTANDNNGTIDKGIRFGGWTGEGIASKRTAGGNQYGLDFYTAFTNRLCVTNAGNIGIGTTTPGSKLEVNGETKTSSLKVGNNGTSLFIVQKGTFTIGSSATSSKSITVNFPNAFSSTPTLVVTVKSDPGWNVGDTFVASIRSISSTSVTFNVQRVDNTAAGWSQNLLLDWIAVQ